VDKHHAQGLTFNIPFDSQRFTIRGDTHLGQQSIDWGSYSFSNLAAMTWIAQIPPILQPPTICLEKVML
jgi:hypothetical protein